MTRNDDLAPSPLDLLPPPPPPAPSSLPSQTHSTKSSSPPSRPIPIEIYNHILQFAFGRHLPPVPLGNRLDEPPSLSSLLPLTLVSKGLRELVLPFLYHHVVIRRPEDWSRLFDPTKGILVGEGEGAARRTGWVKKLSFPRDHFPVSSWTPSKDLPATRAFPHPEPNMDPLNFSGLVGLEEVCVGDWRRDKVVLREIQAAIKVEMEGGPFRQHIEKGCGSDQKQVSSLIHYRLYPIRLAQQTTSVLHFLSQTDPTSIHASLDPFTMEVHLVSHLKPLSIILHHPRPHCPHENRTDAVYNLSRVFSEFSDTFLSSRFKLDPVLETLSERCRKLLVKLISGEGWVRDEAGWWTRTR